MYQSELFLSTASPPVPHQPKWSSLAGGLLGGLVLFSLVFSCPFKSFFERKVTLCRQAFVGWSYPRRVPKVSGTGRKGESGTLQVLVL